jgi:hypothetical protein
VTDRRQVRAKRPPARTMGHLQQKGTTMRWSYVADLGKDGALDWGGNTTGNIPVTERYLWIGVETGPCQGPAY